MSWRAWYSSLVFALCLLAFEMKWIDAPAPGAGTWSTVAAFAALIVFGLAPERERK